MSILITGGVGFIGMELTREFLKRGEAVVIFDKVLNEALIGVEGVTQVKGDITNWPEVMNVMETHKVETVFHLAAILSAICEANPWSAVSINGLGTYHVLEAARLFSVKKVIFTSSMGTYTVTQDTVVDEDTKQMPMLMYGVTKVFSELLGLYYHRKFGIDFRGIRFPQLIGPHVKTFGFGQYNPWLIEAAIKGMPFDVWTAEDTVIPLLYIKDAIRSLIILADTDESRITTRVYNVGQIMPPPTAKDVADAVKRYYPDAQINFKPDPKAVDVLKTIPRVIKGDTAEKEWGWRVAYSLEDTVKDFIAELKKSQ
jgi:nucleoside-diphosphate-sugar epimerase